MKQSARILTGLSVSSDSGDFLYKPWYHWVGPVSVLGFSHVNDTETGGYDVAVKYLRYLATHPSTAKNVATKPGPPVRLRHAVRRARERAWPAST
ncbi:hypothetical protein GCM10025868_30120 [Angustibacter aerolatus]|uniref:Uncharacterized protein n=1 Tax=Angustibacter aerolatus TaxID=1162965 RepID=A0ABQ6JHQ5_9ACTN|nr:DUF1800 family protein [Angustibacter aerolatus]GMA87762.1 hypothetical protein GCM10025868_30120 [Angustibacter aerolatus]